ncbi:hypothetical protein Srufu_021650 [Streptomyces libani subsp. rufus]|nr:hypothetical protein Srufu_021650 [Streptomyces libani subsp. rufus]
MPNAAYARRRTLLAGAALGGAALLTGCSEDSGPDRAEHSSAAERLRKRSAHDSTTLLARYDATLAAHPALESRLRPLRSEVARHAEAFGDERAAPSPGAAPPTAPHRTPEPPRPDPRRTAPGRPAPRSPRTSGPPARRSPTRSAGSPTPVPRR